MKFVQSIRVAIVLLALPLLLSAEPVSQLRPTDYVNDFARVLDPTTIAQLDNITLIGASSQATHDVTFVIEVRMMPVANSHRR